MLAGPRLRQVAVVAADCGTTARRLKEAFGWPEPFSDPGVGQFGLTNAVFAAGDTFVEVVAPVRPDTAAGRYLGSRGGDSGYMAIFQMPDLAEARARVAAAGIRVIWSADLPDIAGTHLHPKDVPGAIVSLDWADPPQSWHWAGPEWTGRAPAHRGGGISGITVEVTDPAGTAARWAEVLGQAVTDDSTSHDSTSHDGASHDSASHDSASHPTIRLAGAAQDLRFAPISRGHGEGITEVRFTSVLTTESHTPPACISGVWFVRTPAASGGGSA